MKKKLLMFFMFISMIFTGCSNVHEDLKKDIYSVNEAFNLSSCFENEYSEDEVSVTGYIVDNPTYKNDLGQVSFHIVDDLDNPKNKITVFAATSEKSVKQYDLVTVKSYLRRYNDKNIFLMGKLINNEVYTSCEVTSVTRTNINLATTASSEVSVLEYSNFLRGKKEHYPLSDEFMEKYQQKDGGYIDLAKEVGVLVDRQQHSPNQYWHFFTSYFDPSVADGSMDLTVSAKSRIYSKLLCPELLLWMYEASEVDPSKVRAAMQHAIEYKSPDSGIAMATMASNMRKCVTWEDIEASLKDRIDATEVSLDNTSISLNIQESKVITASVLPTDTTNTPIWSVIEGAEFISITKNLNKVTVLGVQEGTAKVRVLYNSNVYADCIVTVIDNSIKINDLPTSISLDLNEEYTLTPSLNKGDGTFAYSSSDTSVANVSSTGLIKALTYGSVTITVTSVEYPDVSSSVKISIVDPSVPTSYVYNVSYTQTGTSAKEFASIDELFSSLVYGGEGNGIIDSISNMTYLYGGANGGSGDTKWNTGNIIKFGTGKVNGEVTFNLSSQVNYIKITGYIHGSPCKIRVGDSASSDWVEGATADNKTTYMSCGADEMTIASKDTVSTNQVSTIIIRFESTSSLKLATVNTASTTKKPLYISAIEFGYEEVEE